MMSRCYEYFCVCVNNVLENAVSATKNDSRAGLTVCIWGGALAEIGHLVATIITVLIFLRIN